MLAGLQFPLVSLYLGELDAFNVAQTSLSSGSDDKVIFDSFNSTVTSGCNVKCMCIPSQEPPLFSRLYWIHLAADINSSSKASLRLNNTQMRIVKNYTRINKTDTMTLDGIVRVQSRNLLTIVSQYQTLGIYVSAFRLDNIMKPLVAFSVACSSSVTSLTQIVYDRVFENIGNGWDTTVSKFYAPFSGIYFFSWSCGISSTNLSICRLFKNGFSIRGMQAGLRLYVQSDVDLMSASYLLNLAANNSLHLEVINAPPAYSDSTNWQITFSGFHYSPSSGQQVLTDSSCIYSNNENNKNNNNNNNNNN